MQVICEELSRSDCRKKKFSGLRSDRILENLEIWKGGIMVVDLTKEEMTIDPNLFKRKYQEAMGLHPEQEIVVTR